MSEQFEREIGRLSAASAAEPDYEAMWAGIQQRVAAARAGEPQSEPQWRTAPRRGRRWTALLAASLTIAAAVPVAAGVTYSWDKLWGAGSAAQAIEIGLGERLNVSAHSGGAVMTLHGVAADDRQTNILFTMDVPSLGEYDALEFREAVLTDAEGAAYDIAARMRRDEATGELIGMFVHDQALPSGRESYRLTVSDLQVYREEQHALPLDPSGGPQSADTGDVRYPSVEIESITRGNNTLTVRYQIAVNAAEVSEPGSLGPRLVLVVGNEPDPTMNHTVLPPEQADRIPLETTYRLPESGLAGAEFRFQSLEPADPIEGTWAFEFEADGHKASQAIYKAPLDPAVAANGSDMAFRELVVTPLEIRLYYDDKDRMPDPGESVVSYEDFTLHIVGHNVDVEGGIWFDGDNRYLRFQSPEWYNDWSGVPMTLTMSKQHTFFRSPVELLYPLDPDNDRRTFTADVGGYPVTFTYYMDGTTLVVESEWDAPGFGAIVQTSIMADGKRHYSTPSPAAPGRKGPGRQVERYFDAPQGELQLNPTLYFTYDDAVAEEVRLMSSK